MAAIDQPHIISFARGAMANIVVIPLEHRNGVQSIYIERRMVPRWCHPISESVVKLMERELWEGQLK